MFVGGVLREYFSHDENCNFKKSHSVPPIQMTSVRYQNLVEIFSSIRIRYGKVHSKLERLNDIFSLVFDSLLSPLGTEQ